MGHSLGGTLAAIYCALKPQSIKGLVLLGAPVCFEQASSVFRDAVVSMIPTDLSEKVSAIASTPCTRRPFLNAAALTATDLAAE
jgi:pimeloyl-ACP methyl ester carboxylesterase